MSRQSLLSPTGWVLLLMALVFFIGVMIAPLAYSWGYMAGQRAADQEAVYAAVGDALRVGTRLAGLTDSLSDLRRQLARQALSRLPLRIRDSVRLVRWTTPDR